MKLSKYLLLIIDVLALALLLIISGCADNVSSSPSEADIQIPSIKLTHVFPHLKTKSPIALLQAPGNNIDWYMVEKSGRVLRFDEDVNNKPKTYLDIKTRVDSSHNESGLLGMTFHPQYSKNQQVFVSYTRSGSPLVSYISRFSAVKNGSELNANSEEVILKLNQPYSNHNGGHIAFGPDKYLYIGFGDGGSGGDPQGHGQNTNTLLGAMLRIDVNDGTPYTIPGDNPFAANQNAKPEIYAYGLRNPWRWSFDKITGELWVGDVGQNEWEEVDSIESGGNYGWNAKEGFHDYNTSTQVKGTTIAPVVEYSHDKGCSITGGYVYRGSNIPGLIGVYIYGDFCEGNIWGLFQAKPGAYEARLLLESKLMISSFAQGLDGELYVLHYGGKVYKIELADKIT